MVFVRLRMFAGVGQAILPAAAFLGCSVAIVQARTVGTIACARKPSTHISGIAHECLRHMLIMSFWGIRELCFWEGN